MCVVLQAKYVEAFEAGPHEQPSALGRTRPFSAERPVRGEVKAMLRRRGQVKTLILVPPPPHWGGLDLNSNNSGCACLGSGVVPPLGVVEKEVAVLSVLVRRHRCAVGAVVFSGA